MQERKSELFIEAFLLVAVFAAIALKIIGVIKVSWLVLFSPLWIPFLFGVILMVIIIASLVIRGLIDMIKENKRNEWN